MRIILAQVLFITNCVFNALFYFTAITFKHCNNTRSEKTIDDTKSCKNITTKSGCI